MLLRADDALQTMKHFVPPKHFYYHHFFFSVSEPASEALL